MKTTRWWQWVSTGGLGLALAALTGCQTWVAGMTLPSGRYLEHRPQYFPQDPVFPLTRELASMEAAAAAAGAVPGAPAPLPPPVVPPPPGPLPPPGAAGAPGQGLPPPGM
jgi:hypothetical protein